MVEKSHGSRSFEYVLKKGIGAKAAITIKNLPTLIQHLPALELQIPKEAQTIEVIEIKTKEYNTKLLKKYKLENGEILVSPYYCGELQDLIEALCDNRK